LVVRVFFSSRLRATMNKSMKLRRTVLIPLACLAVSLGVAAPAVAVEPGVVIAAPATGKPLDEFTQASAAKAKWVRLFMDWSVIEDADNRYTHRIDEFDRRIPEYNRRGINVLVVASYSPGWQAADKLSPPRDVDKYAEFVADMAKRFDGKSGRPLVKAWEIWNEPDDNVHWRNGPQPEIYANLLKASYTQIKAANPAATVVTGGMVGNHYAFLEHLYAHGAKGYFDAVGTHTDTACLKAAPDFFYRDPDGRIGRFSFTAYRETRAVMVAHGDPKPIWFTEIGWSSSQGACHLPNRHDEKAGVSQAQQADLLKQAYECLQYDPYVEVALWFSLQDVSDSTLYDHQLGLIGNHGAHKPAFTAFQSIADSRASRDCGVAVDREAPKVTLHTPAEGQQWLDALSVRASATDNVKVDRMDLWVDGKKVTTQGGSKYEIDWQGAKELKLGKHTLTVNAYDDARNTGTVTVTVVKDVAGNIKVPAAVATASIKRKGSRKLLIAGRISKPAGAAIAPKGRVRAYLYFKKGKKWRKSGSYGAGIGKPFRFSATFRKPGRWKVVVRYDAERPYRTMKVKTAFYRVR
jgi:hypothetical protein